MSLTLAAYLPGAGGNHLKNLLCLSSSYANSSDLDPNVYENPDPWRPPGEVWCVGGRNLQDIFFDRMNTVPEQSWVLAAHIGELFQRQSQIEAVGHKKIIIITVEHESDRRALERRQQRFGQHIHPYWLDEELCWLYRPEFVSKHFDIAQQDIITVSLNEFWNKDFVNSNSFASIKQFLNIQLDDVQAHRYHVLWHAANQFE